MQKFSYVAMDSRGKETKGVVEAGGQPQAVDMLRKQGLFPTKVTAVGGGGAKAPAAKSALKMELKLPKFLKQRVKPKELMVLTRQLATLVDSGLPLLRGLRILLKQTKNTTLKDALTRMGEAVESGSTFSESLAQHPRIFDNLYVNMARAGEAGGVLEVVLNRLAEFLEKAERIKNKIKSAMTYPIVVLIAALGITGFLMVTVIPKFEAIFNDLMEGQKLPPLTEFVVGMSKNFTTQAPITIGGIILIVVVIRLWYRTKNGRMTLDRAKLYVPIFGDLQRKTAIARSTRTLGTLMSSGVPVLQALNIVRDTSGNAVVADAYQKVHDNVKEGESMTAPMEASKVFPGMVISMVDVGEETGALPDMLVRIANTYDDEVDNAVDAMTSVIEPILIVFLAVIVGTIVIAMFMPLTSIITKLSSQG
jgi:type IV pilus assembly protein PilC